MLSTNDYIKERDSIKKRIEANDAENKMLKLRLAPLNKLIAADRLVLNGKDDVEEEEWEYPCDHRGCDRAFNSAQGLAVHKRKAHGIKGGRTK